jgi:transcriptional regulator with XRE-family HTH domain
METLTTRNKAEARRIESWVQRQIADLGTARIAEVAGINKSTVSRWRENLVPNMSLLLAILISNRDSRKGKWRLSRYEPHRIYRKACA